MFGNHASKDRNPSGKEFNHRVEVSTKRVEGEFDAVVGEPGMGPNGASNGTAKARQSLVAGRCSFGTIQPGGKANLSDQHGLVFKAEGSSGNFVNNCSGFDQAFGDSGACKGATKGQVGTQVPEVGHNSNLGRRAKPEVCAKPFPGDPVGAESETLVWGNLGTNVFHEVKSEFIAYSKRVFMLFSLGRNHDVVSKQPRSTSMVFDQKHEWPQPESHNGHAQGATLRDPIGVAVGHAKGTCK